MTQITTRRWIEGGEHKTPMRHHAHGIYSTNTNVNDYYYYNSCHYDYYNYYYFYENSFPALFPHASHQPQEAKAHGHIPASYSVSTRLYTPFGARRDDELGMGGLRLPLLLPLLLPGHTPTSDWRQDGSVALLAVGVVLLIVLLIG